MSYLKSDNSILLIIDIQEKLLNAVYNKHAISKKSEIISKAASILNIPTFITEQYPKGLGETIYVIKNYVQNPVCYEKFNFNAILDKNLLENLKKYKRNQIILCGIETHICVSQTAEALINEGFEVSVIKDLCSSRNESEHIAGLDLMKQNGAIIKTTEIVIFELLQSSKHPKFKEIQALII